MPLTNNADENLPIIESGDFVNQGRDKFNLALGFIPKNFEVNAETGELIVTRYNGKQFKLKLSNFFALLDDVAEYLAPDMAEVDKAGIIFLADPDKPEHLLSQQRVLSAAGVNQLIELLKASVPTFNTDGWEVGDILVVKETKKGEKYLKATSPDSFLFDALTNMSDETQEVFCQVAAKCGGVIKTAVDFRIDGPYRQSDDTLLTDVPSGTPVYFIGRLIYEDQTTGRITTGAVWSIVGTGDSINQSAQWTPAGSARQVTINLSYKLPGTAQAKTKQKNVNVVAAATITVPPGDIIYLKPKTVDSNDSNPELAGGYKGSLDAGGCDKVSGWFVKLDNLNVSRYVDIYADGVKVFSNVLANQERTDVRDYLRTNQNVPNLSFAAYGYVVDVPSRLRKGKQIVWRAYAAGTMTELTFSPRTSDTCSDESPTVVYREIVTPSNSLTEGGLAMQAVLWDRMSAGGDRVYPGAINWVWKDSPAGMTVSGTGAIKAGENSINGNTTYTIEAHISEGVVSKPIQVLEAGCTRQNNGFISPKLIYNFIQGGNARLFSSLADANETMGKHFDGSSSGTFSTPYTVQVDPSYAVGTPVWFGSGSDCAKSDDGIRYAVDGNGNNSQLIALLIENGFIKEKLPSTYQTIRPEVVIGSPCKSYEFGQDTAPNASPVVFQEAAVNNATGLLARFKVEAINVNIPIGAGLRASDAEHGYAYLLYPDQEHASFINQSVAFGPSFAYNWEAGKTYWIRMQYFAIDAHTSRVIARIWKETENEDSVAAVEWNDVAPLSGYPVLYGGSRNGSGAFFEKLYVYGCNTPTTPTDPCADQKTAIAVEVTSQSANNYQLGAYFRTPNGVAWKAKLQIVGGTAFQFNDMDELTNGVVDCFKFGQGIGPLQSGAKVEISISPDGVNNIVTRTVTITGNQSRTTIYTA